MKPLTLREFENRYWYLHELKDFASRIGIPSAKRLRKHELEAAIVAFLRTGKAALPTARALRQTGPKDITRGLTLRRRIEHYTSNRETKDFIIHQARRAVPDVREKSGVWYRLNRWREQQITNGNRPTYGDLVRQYIALNTMERFEKIAHGRYYVNFVAEFLAAQKGGTRAAAISAWAKLKTLDVPKDYASWSAALTLHGKGRAMPRTPNTIDDYLAAVSPDQRRALTSLRRVIKATVPNAEECISYDMPAYRLDGKVLVSFAAWGRHCAFYPGAFPIEANKIALRTYDTSKGTVRFQADTPLPAAIVRKLIKARMEEQHRRRRGGSAG